MAPPSTVISTRWGSAPVTVAVKYTLPLIVAPAVGLGIATDTDGAGAGFGDTTAVCAEADDPDPKLFDAVTVTRTV